MLDIFILASTSLPPHPPISPSINQVGSVVMSNVDGVTFNPLLQQMYRTQVLDEDVDLGLSDEELELVVGQAGNVDSPGSDVFHQGNKIIDYGNFKAEQKRLNGHQQIDYICNRLPAPIDKNCCLNPQERSCHERQRKDRTIAGRIWEQIRDPNSVLVKQAHNGLKVNLENGDLCYRDTKCNF